jgi:hypothetical protein
MNRLFRTRSRNPASKIIILGISHLHSSYT